MSALHHRAIPPSLESTADCIVIKEPPYAEPHVRWCERSENESRKKTTSFSSYSIVFIEEKDWINDMLLKFYNPLLKMDAAMEPEKLCHTLKMAPGMAAIG